MIFVFPFFFFFLHLEVELILAHGLEQTKLKQITYIYDVEYTEISTLL